MTDASGTATGNCAQGQPDDTPRPGGSSSGTIVPAGAAGSVGRHLFRLSQALEDAIMFRRARAGTYCGDCDDVPDGGRCDDHACDLTLIAGYEKDARAVSAALGQEISRRLAANAR